MRLKADIDQLETQYKELMTRTQTNTSVVPTPPPSQCSCCERPPCVRALYRALSIKKEELRTQNEALEEQVLSHLNFHDKVAFIAARQVVCMWKVA